MFFILYHLIIFFEEIIINLNKYLIMINRNRQKEIVEIKDELMNMNFLLDYKYCCYEDISSERYLLVDKIKMRWDYNFIYIELDGDKEIIKKLLKMLHFNNIEHLDELYHFEKIQRFLNKKNKKDSEKFYFNFQLKNNSYNLDNDSIEEIIIFGCKQFYSMEHNDKVISNYNNNLKDIKLILKDYKEEIINDLSVFFNIESSNVNEGHFKIIELLII